MNTETHHGLASLNKEDTQFEDLPGIVCFDCSNLLSEDRQYKPYLQEVIDAANLATSTELRGSDHVNLLVQARAILMRGKLSSFIVTSDERDIIPGAETVDSSLGLDIAEIVGRGYPKGMILMPKGLISDPETILQNLKIFDFAFKDPTMFYPEERVLMIQEFQKAIQDLHIVELLIRSDEFKIDSIFFGLGKMSNEERILRRRINRYMEIEIRKLLENANLLEGDVKHIETHSLPISLPERVAACVKFYSEYGEGVYRKHGIIAMGSASAGVTIYNALRDDFYATIPHFYEEYFGPTS